MNCRSTHFIVLLLCCSGVARRVKAKRVTSDASQASGVTTNATASNPVLNGFGIALDVGLDALSKVPVTAMINMQKRWDAREQAAIDEWYEREDPQGWRSNALGFRALEMIFHAMSTSPLISNDDGCDWTDKHGARTKDTRAQTKMRLKWDLYYTGHKARTHRVQFERSYEAKSEIAVVMGGFGTDARMAGPKNFISFRAMQVMRCAVETVKSNPYWHLYAGQPLYKIAQEVSEVLDEYGKKDDKAVSAEMSLRLAGLNFPDAGPCESDAAWSVGDWSLHCQGECTMWGETSSNGGTGVFAGTSGEHTVPTYMRGRYDKSAVTHSTGLYWAFGYTYWLMGLVTGGTWVMGGGPPDWRVKCIDGKATQISVDKEKTWYSWSGFGTYYADFLLVDTSPSSTSEDGYALSMYSYLKKV